MVNCVDVKIANVGPTEISTLTTLMDSLRDSDEYIDSIVTSGSDSNYIVTVKKGELAQLKEALRAVLRVVTAERVEIQPWNGSEKGWSH